MEYILSFEFAILFLAVVQVALLGVFAVGVYMLAKNPNDLNTEEIEAYQDKINENQITLESDMQELYKIQEKQSTKLIALESRFSELHEFVNRGIQRMSARNQRAEELLKFHEDLDELDQLQANPKSEIDFQDPNQRPKLVRNGR